MPSIEVLKPRKNERTRSCRICQEIKKDKELAEHVPACLKVAKADENSVAIGREICNDVLAKYMCMALPPAQVRLVKRIMFDGEKFWLRERMRSLRPGHFGYMAGVGYCKMTRSQYQSNKVLSRDCVQLLEWMVESRLAVAYNSLDKSVMVGPAGAMLVSPFDIPRFISKSFNDGGCVCMCGLNYSPKTRSNPYHSPPPCIAAKLGVESCQSSCLACSGGKCVECPDCIFHRNLSPTSAPPKSLTFLALYQHPRASPTKRVWFSIGSSAFPVRDGMFFLFDGRAQHGLWAPTLPKPPELDDCFYGVAFMVN